jgi:hypothetical protein
VLGILSGMQQPIRRPAAMRAVIVVLLTGFGLWQAWHCSDGMMASPVAGMASMSYSALHAGQAESIPAVAGHGGSDMPAGLAGLCISVLVSILGAVMLIASPVRVIAVLRRLVDTVVRPIELPGQGLVLAQLCVSRT